MADAEGIADREDDVAHLELVAVAERRSGEPGGVNLDDGDVGLGVAADDRSLEFAPRFAERDFHLVGVFDDMVVGQNVAVGRDNDTRAEALLGWSGTAAPAALILVGHTEETAELRVVEERRHFPLRTGFFRREYIHDARGRLLNDGRVAHAVGGVAIHGLGVGLEHERRALGGFGSGLRFVLRPEREGREGKKDGGGSKGEHGGRTETADFHG